MKKYRPCKFCPNPEVEGELILPKGVKICKEVLKFSCKLYGKFQGIPGGGEIGRHIADAEIRAINHFHGRAMFHFHCNKCGEDWDEEMPC